MAKFIDNVKSFVNTKILKKVHKRENIESNYSSLYIEFLLK